MPIECARALAGNLFGKPVQRAEQPVNGEVAHQYQKRNQQQQRPQAFPSVLQGDGVAVVAGLHDQQAVVAADGVQVNPPLCVAVRSA